MENNDSDESPNRIRDREIVFPRPAVIQQTNQRPGSHAKTEMGTQASMEDNKPDLDAENDNLLDFTKPFIFSDVTLVCNGRRLHCHRVILSLHSPVFKRMFESDFKEKETSTVNLPDDYEDVVELLLHMYSHGTRDLNSNTARRLLPLVNKYLISELQNAVVRCISFSMTDSTAPECLLLAERYNLSQMRQNALDACAKWDVEKLRQLVKEYQLPQDLVAQIYERRIEILEKCVGDIQRSFTHSCVRMESKLERVPANHCTQHQRPLTMVELTTPVPPTAPGPEEPAAEAAGPPASRYSVSASIRPAAGMIGTMEEMALNGPQNATEPIAQEPAQPTAPATHMAICEKCVDNFKDHITELCKRAMHKVPIVLFKPNR